LIASYVCKDEELDDLSAVYRPDSPPARWLMVDFERLAAFALIALVIISMQPDLAVPLQLEEARSPLEE